MVLSTIYISIEPLCVIVGVLRSLKCAVVVRQSVPKTATHRIKITANIHNAVHINQVFRMLPNLRTNGIRASLNQKTIKLLLKVMTNVQDIHEIVAPEYEVSRLKKINKIKIIAETECAQTPLLLGVDRSETPLPSTSTVEYQAILHAFSSFRNADINHLQLNTHLITVEEALSLKGIMVFSEATFSQYHMNEAYNNTYPRQVQYHKIRN